MTSTRPPSTGPSTETAREVADMLAARGYPSVAETVRDVADEIDDDHVHQRPDGLWATEPIPAALAGHITGAQPDPAADPIDPPHYRAFSRGAEVIDITENLNFNRGNAVKYCARAGAKPGAGTIEDLKKARWYIDREIGRLEHNQFVAGQVKTHETAWDSALKSVLETAERLGITSTTPEHVRVAAQLQTTMAGVPRPVIGEFYRLRDDVDRLGVPTDAQRVRVLHITHDELSVMVEWPDLPDGPAHQSTMIPVSHLVVTP